MEKTLILERLPGCPGETELELIFGGRELGILTLHDEDLSDFVQNLREGFPSVSFAAPDKRQQDVVSFVQGMTCEDDEQ